MDTLFQLDNELMVELSEDAQELIQGGSISYDLMQDYSMEAFGMTAINGAFGSGVVVLAQSIDSTQNMHLSI